MLKIMTNVAGLCAAFVIDQVRNVFKRGRK